jgi:hypothetical protein
VSEALREVRLLAFPIPLYKRSTEHHEELIREFQLLAIDPPASTPGHEVPGRLLDLIAALTDEYAGFSDAPNADRDAAADRGDAEVDLVFRVPAGVGDACVRLDALLDEADEFCRAGDRLLTLATPADLAALRKWYLGEFPAQLAGRAPTPWPAYAASVSATPR